MTPSHMSVGPKHEPQLCEPGVVNNGIEHHFLRHLMPLNIGNPAPSLVDDVTINGCTSNKPHREGNFPVVIILHLIFFHFRVN